MPGYLRTPGYWARSGGGYRQGRQFYYNRAVNNIPQGIHINNVYSLTVVNNVTVNRVSYNGGAGGSAPRPSAEDTVYEHEQRARCMRAGHGCALRRGVRRGGSPGGNRDPAAARSGPAGTRD